MVKGFSHVTDVERRLVCNMEKEGITWSKMQKITGRSSETLNKILHPLKPVKKDVKKGAPKKLPKPVLEKVLKSMERLQKQNHPKGKEVTAAMALSDAGIRAADRTLQRALEKRNIKFYKLKERQTLTKEDEIARRAWAGKRMRRSKDAWVSKPHAIIDNKHFPLFTTGAGRSHAARRSVRGAYQKKGQAPEPHMVKPKGGNMKFPAPGVTVTAGVINGRIRMWEYVHGSWTAKTAAAMYRGPLVRAMRKAFPEHAAKPRAKWIVFEDNDPTGYKSMTAKAAKAAVGIATDDLPRRSPDLNVLDYALWHTINLRMREQERAWPAEKRESKDEYMKRLRRTALSLPTALVKKCAGDMHRRCRMTFAKNGGLFAE